MFLPAGTWMTTQAPGGRGYLCVECLKMLVMLFADVQ